ncbi:MAG: response regulator, partial [Bdellovibrionales bacterium]
MKSTDINILIIDDDKSMREVLTAIVKRQGYRPIAVGKPEEAESVVKIKPIHGVIADVMLPGCNGVDLVMKIKENLMDNAGIIFVSGVYRDRAFANEAISKTGALDYITKPFDANAIFAKLDKKLNTYVEAPKLSLHNLLASPYASNRDRRKALDQVEDMIGFDLPFVFSILMDSESSGYLNIIDNEENIYGVTL